MTRSVRIVARTLGVVAAGLGLYALAVGSFKPGYLLASLPGINRGRIDTDGVVALAVSAAAFAVDRLGGTSDARRRATEAARIVAAYAAAGWAYLALNTINHPWSRTLPLSHLASWPTEQQTATVCLIVAAVALGTWLWLRPSRSQREEPTVSIPAPQPGLVAQARALATTAHHGQTDRAGQPYIGHPERVAAALAGDETAQAVGWLHDVLEDTPWTAGGLIDVGLPFAVVDAVVALTPLPGEDNGTYWARVRANPLARKVKLEGDLVDNTDPDRLARLDPATRERLEAKYRQARQALTP